MDRVREWVEENIGTTFSSPRKDVFGTNTRDFEIIKIDDEKVSVKFEGSKYLALPLKFWMMERTLEHLKRNLGSFIPIGARIGPPYIPNSIEETIWMDPLPEKVSRYKVAPHICDVLELAEVVEYGYAHREGSRRRLQGVRMSSG